MSPTNDPRRSVIYDINLRIHRRIWYGIINNPSNVRYVKLFIPNSNQYSMYEIFVQCSIEETELNISSSCTWVRCSVNKAVSKAPSIEKAFAHSWRFSLQFNIIPLLPVFSLINASDPNFGSNTIVTSLFLNFPSPLGI